MKIVDKKLEQLREYENNPRNNENAVAAVAASIKEFGFQVPLVIDAAGVIVAGHTRYKAAQRDGFKPAGMRYPDLSYPVINQLRKEIEK